MNDLVISSDVVFVGTVTNERWVELSRLPDSRQKMGLVYDLEVGKVISTTGRTARGRSVSAVLGLYDARFRIDPPIGGEAIFFLRRVGRTDLYRPTSTLGVLDLDGGRLAFPLGGTARWVDEFLDQGWREAIAYLAYFTPQYPY